MLILPAFLFASELSPTSQLQPRRWAGPGLQLGGKSSDEGLGEDCGLLLRGWTLETTAFQCEVVTCSCITWAGHPNCLQLHFPIYIVEVCNKICFSQMFHESWLLSFILYFLCFHMFLLSLSWPWNCSSFQQWFWLLVSALL